VTHCEPVSPLIDHLNWEQVKRVTGRRIKAGAGVKARSSTRPAARTTNRFATSCNCREMTRGDKPTTFAVAPPIRMMIVAAIAIDNAISRIGSKTRSAMVVRPEAIALIANAAIGRNV